MKKISLAIFVLYFTGCTVVLPVTGHILHEQNHEEEIENETEQESEFNAIPLFLGGLAIDVIIGVAFVLIIASNIPAGVPEGLDSDPSSDE